MTIYLALDLIAITFLVTMLVIFYRIMREMSDRIEVLEIKHQTMAQKLYDLTNNQRCIK